MPDTTTTTIEHLDGTKVTTVTRHGAVPAAAPSDAHGARDAHAGHGHLEFEECGKCETTSKLHEAAKGVKADEWVQLTRSGGSEDGTASQGAALPFFLHAHAAQNRNFNLGSNAPGRQC